jgi:hypothetical protein
MRREWGIAAAMLFTAAGPALPQAPSAPPLAMGDRIAGELTPNDAQRRTGKFQDVYEFRGRRGERVELRLGSEAFDSYLLVTGPEGFSLSNDDAPGGGTLDSRLTLELPADGAYSIVVTTFRPGETGAYRLEVSLPAADATVSTAEPAEPIAIGDTVRGRLAGGDGRLASGEYADRYRFTARRGERVRIELAADKFDAYLILRRPDGSQDDNDDSRVEGGVSTDSRIDTVLAEAGDYVIVATSFRPGETGDYRLSLARSPGNPRHANVPAGPRVLALLVGVSDYGERLNPLNNTDDDARRLFDSLSAGGLLHPASRVLTNAEATTQAVGAAFARAAEQAGPNDLFLFFFSGHGDQLDVPVGARELDGRSETIELYDAAITDAELAPLFGRVRSRLALVAIDACYAGGFRNLIDRPNVMGLFSSEEDLTSLVADRFKAGGFLAYFLRSGLGGEADEDGDRIVTAGELATYVRRRFRREGEIPATTREDEQHFQNLVIERGGVHVDDAIVRLAGGDVAGTVPQRPAPARTAAAIQDMKRSVRVAVSKPRGR